MLESILGEMQDEGIETVRWLLDPRNRRSISFNRRTFPEADETQPPEDTPTSSSPSRSTDRDAQTWPHGRRRSRVDAASSRCQPRRSGTDCMNRLITTVSLERKTGFEPATLTALNDLRESTRDIDSVTRLQAVTKQAISEIGQQHGYANDWLNDSAAAFRPSGLRIEDCTVLFDHHALTILGPTADWIFLMKLYAGRTICPTASKVVGSTSARQRTEGLSGSTIPRRH